MEFKYSSEIKNYSIIKEIGVGCRSKVYTAVHHPTNELVTLKKIDLSCLDENQVKLLEEENEKVQNLKCKIILKPITTFKTTDCLFVCRELLDLTSLRHLIDNIGRMSNENIKVILYKILVGINSLHQENVVFRKLTPEDILIDSSTRVKFTNFRTKNDFLDEMRNFGDFVENDLSSIFLAPEYSDEKCDSSVDIWSFGVVAIELVYGSFKKLNEKFVTEIDKLINSNFNEEDYNWIDFDLLFLIKKCICLNPNDRPCIKEILKFPAFKHLQTDEFSQFLRENPEILKIKNEILDLQRTNTYLLISDPFESKSTMKSNILANTLVSDSKGRFNVYTDQPSNAEFNNDLKILRKIKDLIKIQIALTQFALKCDEKPMLYQISCEIEEIKEEIDGIINEGA